jgi:hypothetical protein
MDLLELRKTAGIHCRSKVLVRKAATDVYAATIDDKVGAGHRVPRHHRVTGLPGHRVTGW